MACSLLDAESLGVGKTAFSDEWRAAVSELSDDALGGLRLREQTALDKLERSLRRHGQLEALVVFESSERLEVLDGFKRLHVARTLDWGELRVRVAEVDIACAKVLLLELHGRRGLTALEEAWLVRSLYREHGMSQGAIGERLARHKSWISRRLLLAEQVDSSVQADVRLGLIAPKAAEALAVLSRGNQKPAAEIVASRGLTVRQTQLLVEDLCSCQAAERDERLRAWASGKAVGDPRFTPRAARSEADWIAQDIATLRRVGARLEARLLGAPLNSLSSGAEQVVLQGLQGLRPVLGALTNTLDSTLACSQRTEDVA